MKAGFWEILLIIILIMILFGHSKIPDMMKNLANGINVFKKEMKGDDNKETAKEKTAVAKNKAPVKKKTVAAKPAATKETVKKSGKK